jgi:hypothetical protein
LEQGSDKSSHDYYLPIRLHELKRAAERVCAFTERVAVTNKTETDTDILIFFFFKKKSVKRKLSAKDRVIYYIATTVLQYPNIVPAS